ncbi:PAN2-PAN3 deadenylation complex catalytic subunit PAN2 isoform X2 [Pectinophora gossypiella]|uniref:PAN2-PAN3 deadenylation complex catalytic subunit PAN2 isoform X2 n=1 Tax=Pectinophora gossypiella TaxID=13191 RepID=UPI00214DFD60|nr:PAN2-PAN3 deadenylation complex catalytic subunit PAN2 isoform X2 [Pectinophora gossypiella]
MNMEYHYSDLCIPTDHLLTDHYAAEYAPQYLVPSQEAEYAVRSSVLVDGGDRFGVSAVVFDKYEELMWMGNQGGHVTSYYGPTMQKYTSFQVHESEEVRDIITVEQGIYVLTKSILRHQIRRGIPKHTFRSSNMTDMQCLYQVSPTKLVMGGHQEKLLELDLNKMAETVIARQEEGCAVVRSGGGSLVACGGAGGRVVLRDVRCAARPQHTLRAHQAALSDLDMQGDLLITCGFTQSVNGVAEAEPYVVVWDVRCLRGNKSGSEGAWSISTASPPLLLHFLPAFSGRAVALSGDGHVALLHVNAGVNEEQSVFQVDTNNSLCSVMDVSTTSQALAFGDQAGHLHLFSPQHNHEPVFNNFSRATEFANSASGLPCVSMSDNAFQFSSVPLPPLSSGDKWFNELPIEFFKKVFRKPKPIDPEVLKTMKMQGPIGYAPNPRTFKRNQMPYVEDTLEDLNSPKQNDNKYTAQPVPKHYQKMDVRYNKHSPNEVDAENSNKTGFPGLEATLPNSYCNAMLQVLYYTTPVKATLLAHTCAKEFCLSCELGFLFRMLDTSGGAPCQATNFLRAFRTVPEAAALGLILPDRGPDARVDLIALIQSWNRFILHQIHYEILETRKKEKELALLTNSSPPKPVRMNHNHVKGMPPMVNGQFDGYQYTELEFLGPTTEFDGHGELVDGREDGWQNHVQEEVMANKPLGAGSGGGEGDQVVDNHELSHQQSEREESDISQLFAIGRHQLNRCLKCNKEEERESVVLACALQYPAAREATETRGFVELLRASLAARRSTPAWCECCSRFTPTTQRGRIVRLPPILAINCGGVTAHEKAYWAKGTQKDAPEPSKRGGSGKPCRYGLHCARPGCRFKHPDRPSPTQSTSSKSPTHESHCVLPHQLVIRLQSDGDVIINDKSEQSPMHSPKQDPNKNKKKPVTMHLEEEYTLSAAVVCVEDNPKNLVAYIQTDRGTEPHWYLFNDMTIVPVSAEEVVHFGAWWKTPCVLFYSAGSRLANHEPDS